MKSKNDLIILFHIHKCAGNTFRYNIKQEYQKEQYLIFRKKINPNFENQKYIKEYLEKLTPEELNKVKVLTGHGVFFGIHTFFKKNPKYCVLLRDPFDRLVSNYNFFVQTANQGYTSRKSLFDKNGVIQDFYDWVKNTPEMQNYMTRFLYEKMIGKKIKGEVTKQDLDIVLNFLSKFYFVGTTESLEDKNRLYKILEIKNIFSDRNISEKFFVPTKEDKKKMAKYNVIDYKLYEFVNKNKKRSVL